MISPYHLLLFISVFCIQSSLAAPELNNTNPASVQSSPGFVGYVGDPNRRGTASLIISCLATLILCVWSALHLNVPRQNQSTLGRFFINLRWILIGVFAPEFVVLTAWRQWISARTLSNLILNLRADKQKPAFDAKQPTAYRHEWTMTHSFFASTGGFAFEIEDEGNQASGPFLPVGCPRRLTLTARGIALLAKCGHLPNLPKAEIRDKSKANNIAKGLALTQASWMLVQVIGRLKARLPVTLLEINTTAHVICAFLMYALWWHKPLASNEPLVLRGDWVDSLCAYMYMSSRIRGSIDEEAIKWQTMLRGLFASSCLYSEIPEIESMSFQQASQNRRSASANGTGDASSITIPTSMQYRRSHEAYPESGSERADRWPLPSRAFNPSSRSCLAELPSTMSQKYGTDMIERRLFKGVDNSPNVVSQASINRWTLASSAIETYPTIREHCLSHSHHQGRCLHFKSEQLLVKSVRNWPSDDLLHNGGGLFLSVVLWLACFSYTAIHLSTWHSHFPTDNERYLWYASSVCLCGLNFYWTLLFALARTGSVCDWCLMEGDSDIIWSWGVVYGGLLLIFGRIFIVIEAFLSVRELPAAAYETPIWTQVFPHL